MGTGGNSEVKKQKNKKNKKTQKKMKYMARQEGSDEGRKGFSGCGAFRMVQWRAYSSTGKRV